jgi:pimeloyl-ACP methyl ester carboxylesterase
VHMPHAAMNTDQSHNDIYQAPKPTYPATFWFKAIISRLLFPPILLWDAIKVIGNRLGGVGLGKVILPAQSIYISECDRAIIQNHLGNLNQLGQLNVVPHVIQTHDGAILDGIQISAISDEPIPEPEKEKYIIYFNGNGICYEQMINQMVADAIELQCHCIGFNFRGVCQSTGVAKSKKDLINDGIAQVQFLLDQRVDPEHITLKGHSLGAAVATLVAKHMHDNGHKINIFNGRSFSTITNVVVGHIRTRVSGGSAQQTGHRETLGYKILGWLATPFIKLALALTKWEINAAKAFRAIPEDYKEYMLVRSSAKTRRQQGLGVKDDVVINHYASLHAALKDIRRAQKAQVDKCAKAINNARSIPLLAEELTEAGYKVAIGKEHFKARKMVVKNAPFKDGHLEDPASLCDRYQGFKGSDCFLRFFRRSQNSHDRRKEQQKMANYKASIAQP